MDFFVVSGRNFGKAEFSRRVLRQLDPRSKFDAYVQTPEDAVLSKLDWHRMGGGVLDTQLRGVIGILKTQLGRLDLDYLRKWAVELCVPDQLERVFREAGAEEG